RDGGPSAGRRHHPGGNGAPLHGFDDFPAAATGAPTGGGVLAPPEPGAGRRRGHLRVLPDPAD
ncbi:DUF3499 domain-containing protein, partial [Mycobacterium tuberculosis]